jgi:hypothetical protein
MPYRFEKDRLDYSLFAPGGAFSGQPGQPAFPVRLASEVYQQCARLLATNGLPGPYHLYDPCCGGAYHLSVLGYLFSNAFESISASDIDPASVALAERNLSLLTTEGLSSREAQIRALFEQYAKPSHAAALAQVVALRRLLSQWTQPPRLHTFQADALRPEQIQEELNGLRPDLVFTDIPYGWKSNWVVEDQSADGASPAWRMLEALKPCLAPGAMVAVAAGKDQAIKHEGYRQVKKIKIGLRQMVLLSSL